MFEFRRAALVAKPEDAIASKAPGLGIMRVKSLELLVRSSPKVGVVGMNPHGRSLEHTTSAGGNAAPQCR